MAINIGIVGLPNVGKSTLFNALSSAGAESANFPFCTIVPNIGVVPVPDARLTELARIYNSKKTIATALEFVDIAGLVKGASKGEGLGNKFLAHIRQVDAVAQVVRCFESSDVVHVDGSVDPARDMEVIDTELLLSDIDTVGKRRDRASKFTKSAGKQGEQARLEMGILDSVYKQLNAGVTARRMTFDAAGHSLMRELCLLTYKPMFLIGNVSESEAAQPEQSPHYRALQTLGEQLKMPVLAISAAIEAEVAELPDAERAEYLNSLGLTEPGLHKVIRTGYQLLGLITYLTAGPEESRAWTIRDGTLAPGAAGVIHTDFERGFIKAEVMRCEDLVALKSEAAVRQAGKLRIEGKEYLVRDGDVMHFRFNV